METENIKFNKNLTLSPFIHSGRTITKTMLAVIIALLPATFASIYFFQKEALIVIIPAILASLVFESLSNVMMKRENTIGDLSAVVTALLLALILPPGTPIWITVVGSFFAIIIAKQLFGGLGQNIFNPAAAARGILLISVPVQMAGWLEPNTLAVASATPLKTIGAAINYVSSGNIVEASKIINELGTGDFLTKLFLGNTSGSLGETSALLLLIGGIFLIIKRIIHWEIPVLYIGTMYVLSLIYALVNDIPTVYALIQILSGGLMLGAIFMATDYVTKPLTFKGRVIYAIGLGIFTFMIRVFASAPEGVLFAILLMNMTVPLIDRYTKNRIFGTSRKKVKENTKEVA